MGPEARNSANELLSAVSPAKNDATVISLENVAVVTAIDVALLPRAPMFYAERGDVDLAGGS